jgi:NADH-quinone oxidoreductase subunit J
MSGLVMSTAEQVLFWTVGPIVVIAASALLFAKRAVVTACSVMLAMVGLAFLYVGLDAPFLGVVQVVVYTGAIMMLFVFVLMLVGVDISDSFIETIRGQRWLGALFSLGLVAVLAGAVLRSTFTRVVGVEEASAGNNPGAVANLLFTDYPFTLEVTGCLLVIAAMGAVVLTHRVRLAKKVTQADMAALRVSQKMGLAPPPAPGSYARHNAADIPALDADGQAIEESVPSALRMRGQVHTLRGVRQDLLEGAAPPARRPDAAAPPDQAPAESSEAPDAAPDAGPDAAKPAAPGAGSGEAPDAAADAGPDAAKPAAPGAGSGEAPDAAPDAAKPAAKPAAPGAGSGEAPDGAADAGPDAAKPAAPGAGSGEAPGGGGGGQKGGAA